MRANTLLDTAFVGNAAHIAPYDPGSVLTSKLIAFYKLNEASGTRADASGNGRSMNGGVFGSGTGLIGNAALCTNSGQSIWRASESAFQVERAGAGSATYTGIVGWFKPYSWISDSSSAPAGILTKAYGGSTEYDLFAYGDGDYVGVPGNVHVSAGSATVAYSALQAQINEWNFFCIGVRRFGGGTLVGLRINDGPVEVGYAFDGSIIGASPVSIGGRNKVGTFDGLIDLVSFYGEKKNPTDASPMLFSDADIDFLWNAGAGRDHPYV